MIENKLMLHSVLLRFNDREQEAFNQLITILHRDFYYLAERFCRGTRLMPEDLVQDVLIKIWEKKSMKFDSVQGLKLYVYVALKNRATDNAIRSNRQKKYLDSQSVIEQIAPEIIETEVLSSLNNAINTLPRECAKVLRLHLDGWNIKEIAEKLGKAKSTVYRQRQDSIEIMRKKLSEEIFLIFF